MPFLFYGFPLRKDVKKEKGTSRKVGPLLNIHPVEAKGALIRRLCSSLKLEKIALAVKPTIKTFTHIILQENKRLITNTMI